MNKNDIKVNIDKVYITCPQCKKQFNLIWDADMGESQTLNVRACPSGGIYSVSISCPFCDYEEEL